MVNGWQAKILKTIAARADENKASLMPKNAPVLRYISSVKAMAGSKLVC
jgi:hypothetical protein